MNDIDKVTHRRWNILEELDSEEEIEGFLDAAIKESEGDTAFILLCASDIAKARLINYVAKEAGIDRKLLCDMFQDGEESAGNGNGEAFRANAEAILNATKSFLVPAHA
jgi:probable addiction module antidote protein